MSIKIKKGIWYDETGRKITKEEKAAIQQEVMTELNQELGDKGLEGAVKRFVIKRLVK